MDAAWVTSLLLTSSTTPRHAAIPESRSSARRRRRIRSGVTPWDYAPPGPASGLRRVTNELRLAERAGRAFIAAERAAAGTAGAARTAGAAAPGAAAAAGPRAAVAAARCGARVAARFLGAARHGLACLADELAALFRPARRGLAGAAILLGCFVADVARLFADGAAQFAARLRCQQHAQPGAQHGARQQAHHEPAAALVVIPIEVRHVLLLQFQCDVPLPGNSDCARAAVNS